MSDPPPPFSRPLGEAIVGVAEHPSVGGVWTVHLPPVTWGGVPRRPEGRGDDGKGGPQGGGGKGHHWAAWGALKGVGGRRSSDGARGGGGGA